MMAAVPTPMYGHRPRMTVTAPRVTYVWNVARGDRQVKSFDL